MSSSGRPPLELDLLPAAERDAAWERLRLVCEMWLSMYGRDGKRLPEWAICERIRRLDPATIEAMSDLATQRDFERLLNGGNAWRARRPPRR